MRQLVGSSESMRKDRVMEPAEGLGKSAMKPKSSLWRPLVVCGLILLVCVNYAWFISLKELDQESDEKILSLEIQNDGLARESRQNKERYDSLYEEVKGVASASLSLDLFCSANQCDEQVADAFNECRGNPVGLSFRPEAIGLPQMSGGSHVFSPHNSSPIVNSEGDVFVLGDTCEIGPNGHLYIMAKTSHVYVIGLKSQDEWRMLQCPISAYHMVNKNNGIVNQAINQACLAKAAAAAAGIDR